MSFGQILKTYKWWTILTILLGFAATGLSLLVPKLAATAIDSGNFSAWSGTLTLLVIIAVSAFFVIITQIFVSNYLSEKVALDLRAKLIKKISHQSFQYIDDSTPGQLQTVLTSDVEAVKAIIIQGFVTLVSAILTLIGAIIFLLNTNVRLALYTISIIPLLILVFAIIFKSVNKLFQQNQENIQNIYANINETVTGSALIRILYGASEEIRKFKVINEKSKKTGYGIVKSFSLLIPAIVLLANVVNIIIIWFGGKQVISGTMSLGDFSAFLSYSAMFIWPIFVLGFVGPAVSKGLVSLKRINEVVDADIREETGTFEGPIKGDIEFKNVSLTYKTAGGSDKKVLKNISFKINAKSKNAIVGPTAAGKSQLFYLMSGLIQPTEGEIYIDNRPISEYKIQNLLSQIGLVFQESILFNTSFRENVAFTGDMENNQDVFNKAMETSELTQLVKELPDGLNTIVSERGTSLSGGQKQRLMLARALAVNPQILLLDDFTARVDQNTEALILSNVSKNFPNVTLVSITQKVEPIKNYEQIIVLMEGEIVGTGTHEQLLKDCFEYKQIFESQRSTDTLKS